MTPRPKRSAGRAAGPERRRGAGPRPTGFEAEREPLSGGTIWRARTSWGTAVAVRPMPGFTKSYALLATRYGALDARLPDGTPLPIGIAHFLEHKMFETPKGDVFDLYAKRGASANAFTTFDHTAYLFSCTTRFDENLDTLLDTLHAIHAGVEGVEREKGIIGQEIAMYDDDPSWRSYYGLLEALYVEHPVRLGIAGTKETIAPIDPDILRRTHAAYYHPANLSLCVAGDVDPARVLERAEERLRAIAPGRENRRAPVLGEPREPAKPRVEIPLSVSRPRVVLGIKDSPPGAGPALLEREAEVDLLLDVLFGDGGLVEAPLYREGIADESLGASYQADADYAFVAVTADVDEVSAFQARLLEATEAAARRGIAREDLERSRRRAIGGHLRTFNAPERVASMLLGLHLKDARLSEVLDAVNAVTVKRLAGRLESLLAAGRAWCVVTPRSAS